MLLMVGANSIFAAYEIALASVSLGRLQRLAHESQRGAKVALYMKENMEASLAVVQLGITLVGAVAAAVGGAGAEENLAPVLVESWGVSSAVADVLAIVMVVLPLITITIIFGELIPKVFALRNAEWLCLKASPFMRWFSLSVWPAVWLFEWVVTSIMSWGEKRLGGSRENKGETEQLKDLRTSASLARASRLIGHREEGIILGATEMRTQQVREIMLPAEHMAALPADTDLRGSLIAAHLDMHTRFPVVEREHDPQSVMGYVNVKDIIAAMHVNPRNPTLRGIVRSMPSFDEETSVVDCLERLMREHTHIALVRGAEGQVVGMVTLEDILEELVGEIEDEYDRLPSHLARSGTSWVVGGGASLERLQRVTGIDLRGDSTAQAELHSLNDWVRSRLNREVTGGDVVEAGDIRVLVRKVRRAKVQEALLSRLD